VFRPFLRGRPESVGKEGPRRRSAAAYQPPRAFRVFGRTPKRQRPGPGLDSPGARSGTHWRTGFRRGTVDSAGKTETVVVVAIRRVVVVAVGTTEVVGIVVVPGAAAQHTGFVADRARKDQGRNTKARRHKGTKEDQRSFKSSSLWLRVFVTWCWPFTQSPSSASHQRGGRLRRSGRRHGRMPGG